jgi:hypothetical protein
MARTTARRIGANACVRAFFLALLAIGLATALSCSPGGEPSQRYAFTAEVLDTLDAAMTRLAADRWPSWTMRIQAGQLAFRIEASAEADEEAQRGACSAIAQLVRESVGARVPWHAEITRGGRLLKRCSAPATDGQRVG